MRYRNVLRGQARLCRADDLLSNVHAPLTPPARSQVTSATLISALTLASPSTLLPLASLFSDPTPPIPAALASRLTHTI